MSSILDALRKVEAEKTKDKVDLGEVEELLAEKELLVPDEKEPRPGTGGVNRAAIVMVSAAVVVLFGVGGFLLYGRLAGARRAEITENRASGFVPPEVPRPPDSRALEPPQQKPLGPTAEDSAVQAPVAPAAEADRAAPEGEAIESPAAPTDRVTTAVPKPAPLTPKAPAPRPALKINILRAASEEFPEPLAVVNGKKAAVGDNVDGAKVLEIRNDGILFEYAGESFLVPF